MKRPGRRSGEVRRRIIRWIEKFTPRRGGEDVPEHSYNARGEGGFARSDDRVTPYTLDVAQERHEECLAKLYAFCCFKWPEF
jgi:hypothetical protein